MATSDPLGRWHEMKKGMRRSAFVQSLPYPFLWIYMEGETNSQIGFLTGSSRGARQFPEGLASERIVPIRNAGKGPFPDRIMVGRSHNCDVVLAASSVSKLHAIFRDTTPEDATLIDRNSRNGTTVNHTQVAAGEGVRVQSGDELTFGLVTAAFLSAGDLYDRL